VQGTVVRKDENKWKKEVGIGPPLKKESVRIKLCSIEIRSYWNISPMPDSHKWSALFTFCSSCSLVSRF